MNQAVCLPPVEPLEREEPAATRESIRQSIQSRWQDSPRIDVHYDRGYPVLDLGTKEIWDGSDLCLLRDTLVDLCQGGGQEGRSRSPAGGGCRTVGIEMKSVKGIPTGFFGMLHDLHVEEGIAVHLLSPQPNVCGMLWFRTFCESDEVGGFVMLRDPKPNVVPGAYHFWASLRGEDFVEASSAEFTSRV